MDRTGNDGSNVMTAQRALSRCLLWHLPLQQQQQPSLEPAAAADVTLSRSSSPRLPAAVSKLPATSSCCCLRRQLYTFLCLPGFPSVLHLYVYPRLSHGLADAADRRSPVRRTSSVCALVGAAYQERAIGLCARPTWSWARGLQAAFHVCHCPRAAEKTRRRLWRLQDTTDAVVVQVLHPGSSRFLITHLTFVSAFAFLYPSSFDSALFC